MTNPGPDPTPPRKKASRKKPVPLFQFDEMAAGRGMLIQTVESPSERRSRLMIEEKQAAHELWRDRALLICCVVSIPILALACLVIVLWPGQPADVRTWATSTLAGLVAGFVGYSLRGPGKGS